MPDERLARWAARGSEAAFAVIFERHHQALHRYCHSIVGNGHDASDALQCTMLKAFRALSGETREISLRPWLYRIAHNESISLLRARRSDADLDSAAQVGDPSTEALIESRDRLRALAADLTELTEQQRGALLMRELGGLKFAEISAALGISAAAAKQSVYESRCVLQTLQDGREMDCDVVRRTLSDGDRRMLRGKRLRGHLSSCGGCRDFERALRGRPAELAMLAPPLPMAAAATMLGGLLGSGTAGGGFGAGGALVASLTGGAKGVAGVSLATKIATVAVVGTTIVGGGAVIVMPDRGATAPPARSGQAAPATGPAGSAGASDPTAAAPRISAAHAPTQAGEAALMRANAARTAGVTNGSAGRSGGATSANGKSPSAPGQNKPAGSSAAAQARRGGSPTAQARRSERAAIARGNTGRTVGRAPARAPSSAAALARAKAKALALAQAKSKAKAEAIAARRATPAPAAATTSPGAGVPREPR